MMKKIMVICLSVLLIFAMSAVAYADVIIDVGDWSIAKTPSNKAWEIRAYNGTDTEITLLNNYGSLNVTSLGPHCFSDNTDITSVTMNQQMQGIKDYAFLNSAVSTVVLNSRLINIGKGAFSGTSELTHLNLEITGVQSLEEYTFLNSGLVEITLPETMRTIGSGAFMQCASLEKAVIPVTVTEIADNAFSGCDNLTIYCYTDSYAHQYAEANGIEYVLIDAPQKVTFLRGDADGDGDITIMDATKIQRYLVNLETDEMIAVRGQIGDDDLDILDATRIQRFLAGFNDGYDIGEEVTVEIG